MLPLIVDTDGDRALLEQMVVDACSSGVTDVAVFLMKLMVMDRAPGLYGESTGHLPNEVTCELQRIVREDGWRGIEAIQARMDQMVASKRVGVAARFDCRATLPLGDLREGCSIAPKIDTREVGHDCRTTHEQPSERMSKSSCLSSLWRSGRRLLASPAP